ncbi:MAG: hypothetical protein IKD80_09870 [Selenomonadaceae bacterium]|nr:hypothetical protein [Selenomonadaceae bacterium]
MPRKISDTSRTKIKASENLSGVFFVAEICPAQGDTKSCAIVTIYFAVNDAAVFAKLVDVAKENI